MLINPKKAAAAVLALLLLLAACSPAKEGSSSAPAETSAPPSESLEYEGEHDHTGIPAWISPNPSRWGITPLRPTTPARSRSPA